MCDIQSIQLTGQSVSSQGFPAALEVSARIDCAAVNIEIRRLPSDSVPFLSAAAVPSQPTSQPPAGVPPRLVVHSFAVASGQVIACNETLHVTIVCSDDATCRASATVPVGCKGFEPRSCPATVVLEIAPPLDQTAECVAAGFFTISVVDPTGLDVTYFWSRGPVGAPSTALPGSNPQQIVQVQGGDPPTIVSVIAAKTGCPPVTSSIILPAGHDEVCPTAFAVEVSQGPTRVAGPHLNTDGTDWDVPALPAATYTVRITQPAGGAELYEWFGNDGTLIATGAANEVPVTIAAGQVTTVSFRIKPSDCCPAMMGSVTLTGTAAPDQPGDDSNGTPPREPEPEREIDPPVIRPPALCPLLRLLLALALIAILVSVISLGCPMLAPAAVAALPVALIVAAVLFLLVAVLCRPSVCGWLRLMVWALMWGIVIGAGIALLCLSALSAFIVVLFGGITAALIWTMVGRGCRVPTLLSGP